MVREKIEVVQTLVADPKVCGVSNDILAHWKHINENSNSKLLNEIESKTVKQRYFGKSDVDSISCSKEIYEICVTQKRNCDVCPLSYNCLQKRDDSPKSEIAFADFFCGAGGISVGFESAGLTPLLANDIDPWFVLTYVFNRPKLNIEYSACDINEWLIENNNRRSWEIDIVSGGVPCQSFSSANRQRLTNDKRDNLYSKLLSACNLIKPKIILIENVSGILSKTDNIYRDLDVLGYYPHHFLINAKDFGIPQKRKRVFFLGLNKNHFQNYEKAFITFNSVIESFKIDNEVVLWDSIKDLDVLSAHTKRNDTKFNNEKSGKSFRFIESLKKNKYVNWINCNRKINFRLNHKARYNNDRDIEIFGLLEQGENSLSEKIAKINPYKNRNNIFKDKYYKLESNKVCKTITAHMRYDCNMYIHPFQSRGLTAREAARVQSFPDDYAFLGNFQRLYQQIGNAVPPKIAEAIGIALKQIL